MSFPPISDVFFPETIRNELGIHFQDRDNFERIPPISGVYAWFYPLTVTSLDLDEFLNELRQVHLYDAREKASPGLEDAKRLGWFLVKTAIQFENPPTEISPTIRSTWKRLTENEARFDKVKRIFMRASLLMPPLYVGKATTLSERCHDHIRGETGFAQRYRSRAQELGFHCKEVSDLILLTLETSSAAEEDASEKLVEKVLNLVGRPPYGVT